MYQINNMHREALDQGHRGRFGAYIEIGGNTIDVIHQLEIKSASSAGGSINIGACISSSMTFELEADTIPEDEVLKPFIEMEVYNTIEQVPMGQFHITEAQEENGLWTGTAYDNLILANEPYRARISFPASMEAMCKDAAALCGVEFAADTSFPAVEISEAPEGKTCAWVFSKAAELLGCNVFADRLGKICFRWYTHSIQITPNQHYDFSQGVETKLTSIACDTGKENITAGTGSGISITNPYMTEDILESVLALRQTTYTPISTSFIGDMTVDPWDIITISKIDGTQYDLYVMSHILQYDGGLISQVESYAATGTGSYIANGRLSKKIVAVEKSLEEYKVYVAEYFLNGDTLKAELAINKDQILSTVSKTYATTAAVKNTYATKTEVSETYATQTAVSTIAQTVDAIRLSLDDCATKSELTVSKDQILSTVSKTYATTAAVKNTYATKTAVSNTYATKTEVSETYATQADVSTISQTVDSIQLNLSNYATKAELALKISNKVATISGNADVIKFTSGKFILESTYASISSTGEVTFTSGTIGGFKIEPNSLTYKLSNGQFVINNSGQVFIDRNNKGTSYCLDDNGLIFSKDELGTVRLSNSAEDPGSIYATGHVQIEKDLQVWGMGTDAVLVGDVGSSSYVGCMVRNSKRQAGIYASEAGNFGLFDITSNGRWIIRHGKDGYTYIPDKLHLSSGLELLGTTPYIDFHYGNSTADYTSRIIETASGVLQMQCNDIRISPVTSGATPIFRSASGVCQFGAASDSYVNYISGSEVRVCNTARSAYKVIKASAFTTQSSVKTKENIAEMTEEEAKKTYDLNVVTFDYKNGEKDQRGLIAEEAIEIIPSCVFGDVNATTEEEIMGIGIDYARLVPYLIKNVQALKKEIDQLKGETV